MDMYSLIGFAALSAVAAYTVKQFDSRMGASVTLAASVLALMAVLAEVTDITEKLNALFELGGLSGATFKLMLKAVGIAYLTRLSASLCRDLNEGSLALVAETGGKMLILMLTLPIFIEIADMIKTLIDKAV